MSANKADKLEGILRTMISKSHEAITSCVVTTERGLIVAGVVTDHTSSDILSAMVSLMSDTAARVCGNLGYGNPKTALVQTMNTTIAMAEFPVMDRRFRMGAVLSESRKFSIFGGRLVIEKRVPVERIDGIFNEVTRSIREILER